jgi:hypothetical protein
LSTLQEITLYFQNNQNTHDLIDLNNRLFFLESVVSALTT